MMNWRKAALGIPATLVCLGVIACASDPAVRSARKDSALLRLSWSARPERIEKCRELTPEELAARGEHMRQRVDCAGYFASYDLEVSIDGRTVHRSVARGAGLRNDRPIFLLEEVVVAHVRPRRADGPAADGGSRCLYRGPAPAATPRWRHRCD